MKNSLKIGILVTVALGLILAWSTRAEAQTCDDALTQNTTLTGDILNCPSYGLWITANNVTLDCDGHTISGSGQATGVYIKPNKHYLNHQT